MKRSFWGLLLAVLLLAAGCGVSEPEETTEPPLIEVTVPYEEPVQTLRYEGIELSLQSMWLREDPQARVLTEAAQLFEKQTGAAVTVIWPGSEETAADIMQLSATDFAVMPAELALDLTDFAENADYAAKSHETVRSQIMEQCGYLGAVAQVPYLGGIYYNADAFAQCGIEETPKTWDEFLSLCQILRQDGWQPLTLDKDDAVAAMELHLRRAIGVEEVRRLMGKGARWDVDMPAIDAMEQVMTFVHEGNMATGSLADAPAGQNKMALSNSAMMIGTNADCAAVEDATLIDLNWGVFPYPGAMDSGSWMTADVLVIHRDCRNAQAAFDFVMLLVTGEFDQLRADISCGIPADPSNASPIPGAMETIAAAQPQPLGLFGSNQQNAAVKLWSGWYDKAGRYASLLELSKG